MKKLIQAYVWALLRIFLGFIFLWAFLDKLFGLGFSTVPDKSWLMGGSPTSGFLKMGTHGPFASIFQSMAGNPLVDWLFMLGLLLIGLALILGIGLKIAGYSGSLLLLLMWMAAFPPKTNPVIDEHIIYILILLGLTTTPENHWWSKTKLVKKYPILK